MEKKIISLNSAKIEKENIVPFDVIHHTEKNNITNGNEIINIKNNIDILPLD